MRLLAALLACTLIILPSVSGGRSLIAHASAPAAETALAYSATATPKQSGHQPAPPVSAASWYAVDVATGLPLGTKNASVSRPIASITKLATALVIVHDHSLNQALTVPQLPAYASDDEILHLTPGERFRVRDLLAAMLINSADDAADALALADSGTESAFVAKMNHLVATWGITDAHFSNPSGLVDDGNGASAQAVATMARLVLQNPTLQQLVRTPSVTITDATGRAIPLATTDQLLQSGQFQGIKTGYTGAAGQCFVGLVTIQSHQVITVVLGSQDRFGDTLKLVNWINQTYQWQPPH